MRTHTRGLAVAAALLALGGAALGPGFAADDDDIPGAIRKLADAVEKKDAAAIKKGAEDIGKKASLDEVMHRMAARSKKGEGFGPKPFTPPNQDGIEAKIMALGKKALPKATLEKEAADIARASYLVAAVAEVAILFAPEKKEGNKNPKDWVQWSKDMREASLELAEAAKKKDEKLVKTAASKLNSSCNNCHGVFRNE